MTDGQSPTWERRTIYLFLSLIVFKQLRICWCGELSLTRGRVCNFQLLLSIANAVFLGLSPAGLTSIIFLPFIDREREREKRKLGC
jgi:hypothetical protein